jgi:hypothetical protein
MILSGPVERPRSVYRSPKYRIGLYRAKAFNGDVENPENAKRIEACVVFWRASIGRSRYNYLGLMRLGLIKRFGIRLKNT